LRAAFSQERVFVRVCRQALGVLCALGVRTVSRVLAATGRDQCPWSSEYRLFSRSPWAERELFFPIIEEALRFCPAEGPIALAGDFTHVKKSGQHIAQVVCMRDPLSPAFHTNLIYGLRFFQLTVLCPFRAGRTQPLPARSVPVRFEAAPVLKKPGKRADAQARAEYRRQQKTRPTARAARRALVELREDFDRTGAATRGLLVTLDGSFCNRVFFWEPIARVDLLCRCRKDAVLCERAPAGGRSFYGKESLRGYCESQNVKR
jgi:hypothetical protein